MEARNAFILKEAFANMGYRHMDKNKNFWGKPVGFGIIIAEIKDEIIEFKTMFNDAKFEANIWGSSTMNLNDITNGIDGDELYHKYVYNIAYREFVAHAEKMFFPNAGEDSKTFDFNNIV